MRKFKKGLLAVLTAGLLATTAFGIAACGGGDETGETPATPGEATVYTVKFETNGGTLLPEQGANPGDKAVKPGNPKKAGYTFGGWYTNAACTQEYNFEAAVNADTTIYAKWTAAPTTDAGYFRLTQEESGWSVAAKPGTNLPTDVVIPSAIDGKTITSVSVSGFEDVGNIQSVTLPDTVTTIGQRAFRNCTDLEVVLGGANVEMIDSDAFDNTVWDNNLPAGEVYLGKTFYKYASSIFVETEIDVKDGTVGIASGAFLNQPNLVGITLPEGLKYIGSYAFGADSAVNANGVTEVVLPDSVVEVSAGAFRYAPIETLVIGKGVEYIGAKAFVGGNISYLEYNAPKGVIANATFEGMEAPATVKVADDVKDFPVNLFTGWTGLTSVDLGTGITVIPANAFDGLENLATLKFGAITRIGNNAFRGIAVPELTVPETVTRIGASAFANNAALKKVTYNPADATAPDSYFAAFKGCGNLNEVVIGDTVKVIPKQLFYCQDSVTKLTLGSKLEKIGYQSFYGTGLEGKLVLPSSLKELGDSSFAAADDSAAESFGSKNEMRLTKVTIPATLERLGSNAFARNTYLTALDWYATHVENFAYSERVNQVATFYSAFNGCKSLKNVTIGSGIYDAVTELPAQFLQGCTAVESIDLNKVTKINSYAFDGCTKLADVGTNNLSQLATLGTDALKGTAWYNELASVEGPMYIGKILVGYSGTMPDSYALNITAGTTTVGDGAFQGKSKLASITFPTSLTTIGTNAFYNCTGLTGELTLGTGILEIGKSAFYNCNKLTKIVWNSKLQTIGENAFESCKLTEMVDEFQIPKSVTKIGSGAFQHVVITGKISVEAGSTLEEIPTNCFKRAKATEIDLGESVTTLGTNWCGYEEQTSKTKYNQNWLSSVTTFNAPNITYVGSGGLANLKSDLQAKVDTKKLTYVGSEGMYGWEQETVEFGDIEFGGSIFARYHSNKSAAYENTAVKKVIINGAIEEIGDYAFFKSYALGEVELKHPEALKKIGQYAFNQVGSKADNKTLTINVSHVTEFGDYAFSTSKFAAENLKFSDDLEKIGDYAFDSTSLTGELVVGQKLERLGKGAFTNPNFTKLTIKGNLAEVANNAFRRNSEIGNHSNLTEVTIEEGVRILDGNVFSAAAGAVLNLPSTIEAAGDLTGFAVVNFNGYIEPSDLSDSTFSKSAALHIDKAETLAKYEDGAIWASYKNQFVGPDGYKYGWYLNGEGKLLQYKGSKTEIKIPKEATSFSIAQILTTQQDYQAEKTFTLEQGNTNYKLDEAKKMLTSADGKTLYYYYGTADNFNDGTIETVMPYAFAYSTTLKTLTLPKATSLGANMVLGTSVTSITVDAVSEVGASAFKGLTTLTTFSATKATKVGESAFDGCTTLANVTLTGVTEVGANAFKSTSITNASLAFNKLTSIGNSAFSSCKQISGAVDISAATTLGTGVFSSCSAITSVTLNSTITAIPASMFQYCNAFKGIKGATITKIGGSAFYGCAFTDEGIEATINNLLANVTEVGSQAFNNCNLVNIKLPKIVKINANAFSMKTLKTIEIGTDCTEIGSQAFCTYSDNATYTLTIKATTPPTIANDSLARAFKWQGHIQVPTELVDTYKAATGWKDYKNDISAIAAE